VKEERETIGIVPLVVRDVETRLGALRYLTYPLDEWGSTFGPIGPRPADTLAAAMRHIAETPRTWEVLEPRWVAAAETDLVRAAMNDAGLTAIERPWLTSPVVRFEGTFADYMAAQSSHWRNNFKRNERKLAEMGEVRVVRHRPAGEQAGDVDPNWQLFDDCQTIARSSWQSQSETGTTISHGAVRQFLRDLHEAASRLGMIDTSVLYVGERPAAFWYCYHCRGRLFGLRTGYDAEAGFQRAGTVLTGRLIEDSFGRGDTLFDMGPGSTDWKRFWQTGELDVCRLTHYSRRALRAQAIHWNLRARAYRARLKSWSQSVANACAGILH
jgi:CelD/BcsL family acetyltransferase involved in cellulose biosynthesis